MLKRLCPTKIFENEEIKAMFTAFGVSIGTEDDSKALNLDALRYHKVIIMTDADVDGSHIATLILTFFYRHMKEMIERGYVYIATPPLYQMKKGRESRYAGMKMNGLKLLKNGTPRGVRKELQFSAIKAWER